MYRIPTSTYRLQFNAGFTFNDARRIVPYLADLGISDIYASPILKARKGSTHGYDVVDAAALNPELGTEEEFDALHRELKQRNLGLLLDVVPNHMAASPENAWWMSVLENGPRSRYLHYFDIERIDEKLLLPILGRPYGEALESQEIRLGFDQEGFFFRYYDHRLPLAPESYRVILRECVEALPMEGVGIELRELVAGDDPVSNSRFLKQTVSRIYEQDADFRQALDNTIERINGKPGDGESFNTLDALLDAQWYRLAYWRIASEKINYRRFFDVTDLVGVRVENPEVFEARNRRTLDLIAEEKVTGLRIDHIDGLYDPVGHMKKLQLRLADPNDPHDQPCYIVVEKILARDERLPHDFPIAGTVGYDFLDSVNAVFVDSDGLGQLTRFYRAFTGIEQTFDDVCYERKKQVISELFAGEMRHLGKQLSALAMRDRNARDFAPVELLGALTEITACMHVYRTYVRDPQPCETARQQIRRAVAEARRRARTTIDQRIFDFLEAVLTIDPPTYLEPERESWLAFVMRWQQFTGRVMAKGVEDTAFYNYNRLVSLNEVGGDPGRSGRFDGMRELHERNCRQFREWPHTLNATSTHDTKRSEDVRARLNVLSEMAPAWERAVRRWSKLNAHLKRDGAPDPNEELLIYQTLLGMWPFEEDEVATVDERLRQYVEKAAREAKTHTSWIAPNVEYEQALLAFAGGILANDAFRADFAPFQRRVAFFGFLNSLSQTVLKLTAPGVPDFYQGSELWDFSLVDPDNRRAVDYEKRQSMLRRLRVKADLGTMLRRFGDGRIKMFVTWKTLELRPRISGAYSPIDAGRNVVAFTRGNDILVLVPRFATEITKVGVPPLGSVWGDATCRVPRAAWRNIFTGETLEGDTLRLADVFARMPVAVFAR
jgi:(1->4)-alpha-D-glucan 1-alpha-D-glucosylmutase